MNERSLAFIVWMFLFLLGFAEQSVIRARHAIYTEIFTKPGDTVLLPCDISNVTGLLRWLRNEQELPLGDEQSERFHMGFNQTSRHHFLRIQGALMEDDGIWHCQDVREHHSWIMTSKPMRVVVVVPPSQPHLEFEEKRLPEEATFTTKEKNSLNFHCVVENVNPAPEKVEWFLDEENMTSTAQFKSDFSQQDRLYNAKSSLTLEITRKYHRKYLACHVYHMAREGSVITRIVFNILYTPSFVISRLPDFGFPIHEGIEVSLKCDVNANPPSQPQWIKDDGPPPVFQTDDGYLNFTTINRDHAGWYRCSTHHQFGDFASFGYFLNVRC